MQAALSTAARVEESLKRVFMSNGGLKRAIHGGDLIFRFRLRVTFSSEFMLRDECVSQCDF